MFKLFVFACILAFVAAEAKPGLYAPIAASPLAYTAPLAYSNYGNYIYGGQSAYSGYAPSYYKGYNYGAPLAYPYAGSYYY